MALVMVLSEKDLLDVVFNTLHWDAGRGGHTVETLIRALYRMGVIGTNPPWATAYRMWGETQVRTILGALLHDGRLDMDSRGNLQFPAEDPDPLLEVFNGGWYVTLDGSIIGPLGEGEAKAYVCNQLHSASGK